MRALVARLDELINGTHGSRTRLLAYVRACDPQTLLGRVSDQQFSKQLRGLDPYPLGPDWSYVEAVVYWCLPVELHQARRRQMEEGDAAAPDVVVTVESEQVDEVLNRVAGSWCLARNAQRPPRPYKGRIVYPTDAIPSDVADLEGLADSQEQIALCKAKLEQARHEVNHATREANRLSFEYDSVMDQLTSAAETREAILEQVRRLQARGQQLAEDNERLAGHLYHEQEKAGELRRQARRLDAAIEQLLVNYVPDETARVAVRAAITSTPEPLENAGPAASTGPGHGGRDDEPGRAGAADPGRRTIASPWRRRRRTAAIIIIALVLLISGVVSALVLETRADGPATTTQVSSLGASLQRAAILTRDTGGVNGVTFSPDGRMFATGSSDATVQLWRTADPLRPVWTATLARHTRSGIYGVAFSPRSQILADSSGDGTVSLWNVRNPGDPYSIGVLRTADNSPIWSVAFSPDGRTLATGSSDDTVRLWDVANPARPHPLGTPLTGHTDAVYTVAFSPDGRTLATGSSDDTVRLWD
ncbi:MAG: hypothetical protein ACQSGP_04400, partial [Frankia sp.]